MANQFQDLTSEDFGEALPANLETPAQTAARLKTERDKLPKVKEQPSKAELIEPSWLKRGLAGAGRSMVNKYRGLTGQGPAEGEELEQDTTGRIGGLLPDVLGSVMVPARILPQAAYGFATRAVEPAPNLLERLVAGAKGSAEFGGGQAAASAAVRGVNALSGNLTHAGTAAKAAKLADLNLTAGDILDSRLLRLAEEKSILAPGRNQADEIAKVMNTEGGDPITVAIKSAYDAAQAKVSNAAARLDDLISAGNLPHVTPRKTYEHIQQIAKRSPDTLKNVRDPELQQILEEVASYPSGRIPKGMGFAQLDELRKALGPVMAKVEMQSKSGASNVTTADANRWKQLYRGIMEDIDAWGAKSATEDALKAHKELSSTFKSEVLPLREHPVAGKVLEGGYARPEDLLRDLTSPRNRSVINDLYGKLDIAGQNAFDALRLAKRGSKEFIKGEPSTLTLPEKVGIYGALGASPMWLPNLANSAVPIAGVLAAEQALVHGLNSPIGRAIASGSPKAARGALSDAAIQAGIRPAAPELFREAME